MIQQFCMKSLCQNRALSKVDSQSVHLKLTSLTDAEDARWSRRRTITAVIIAMWLTRVDLFEFQFTLFKHTVRLFKSFRHPERPKIVQNKLALIRTIRKQFKTIQFNPDLAAFIAAFDARSRVCLAWFTTPADLYQKCCNLLAIEICKFTKFTNWKLRCCRVVSSNGSNKTVGWR